MEEERIAGLAPGSLKEGYRVRILVCLLMKGLGCPLKQEEILEIFSREGSVDYFTLVTALSELISTGHLTVGKEDALTLSALGAETAVNLKEAIPLSLRDKVLRAGYAYLEKKRRDNEIKVEIVPHQNGFHVVGTLHEGALTYLSLSFFAPDKEQSERIAKNFYRKADTLYQKLLEDLIG